MGLFGINEREKERGKKTPIQWKNCETVDCHIYNNNQINIFVID